MDDSIPAPPPNDKAAPSQHLGDSDEVFTMTLTKGSWIWPNTRTEVVMKKTEAEMLLGNGGVKAIENEQVQNRILVGENTRLDDENSIIRMENTELKNQQRQLKISLSVAEKDASFFKNENRRMDKMVQQYHENLQDIQSTSRTLELKVDSEKRRANLLHDNNERSKNTISELKAKDKKSSELVELAHKDFALATERLEASYALRNNPIASAKLQKRLGKEMVKSGIAKPHVAIPNPCWGDATYASTDTINGISLGCVASAKPCEPVGRSQDRYAYGEVDGNAVAVVADGVSRSHRQEEWSHRIVEAVLVPNGEVAQALKKVAAEHQVEGPLLRPLLNDALTWAWDSKSERSSHATLIRAQLSPKGKCQVERVGDTWAVAKTSRAATWKVILSPSSENGTKAVDSQNPVFPDEIWEGENISKLIIMTDGFAKMEDDLLDNLFQLLLAKDDSGLAKFIEDGRANGYACNDDVTAIALQR